jgi:VIT1/CCC1 family predicted Fe2+/Mn2+ transporter
MIRIHRERHAVGRIGWLRAAVLGANDGVISTASLIVGVAAAGSARSEILVAAFAGLVAGAMSMAAGEYVSVSSQSDTEKADLAREARELRDDPAHEREELTNIYIGRGLDDDLARRVADQLTAKDALAAHARDELNITDLTSARPIQAALTSALTFSIGAAIPLLSVFAAPSGMLIGVVSIVALSFLAILGGVGARAGRAPMLVGVLRVAFWGAIAMAVTALIGRAFGTVV